MADSKQTILTGADIPQGEAPERLIVAALAGAAIVSLSRALGGG